MFVGGRWAYFAFIINWYALEAEGPGDCERVLRGPQSDARPGQARFDPRTRRGARTIVLQGHRAEVIHPARVLREGRPVQGPTNLQSRFPNDGFSALSSGYQMSQRGLATKKYRTVGQYRTPGRLSHRSDQRTTRPHIADRHTHQVLGERTTQSYRPARPGG